MFSSTEMYVGNDVGVYQSIDGGLSFTPFMNGLPQGVVVTDLKYSEATNTLTAGTYGRGAWQVNPESTQAVPILGQKIYGFCLLLFGLSLVLWYGLRGAYLARINL